MTYRRFKKGTPVYLTRGPNFYGDSRDAPPPAMPAIAGRLSIRIPLSALSTWPDENVVALFAGLGKIVAAQAIPLPAEEPTP